jgi:hypothetical protein
LLFQSVITSADAALAQAERHAATTIPHDINFHVCRCFIAVASMNAGFVRYSRGWNEALSQYRQSAGT